MNRQTTRQKARIGRAWPALPTVVALLFATGFAAAAPGDDALAPSVLAQISAIQSEKASRTPTEAKLDSNVLYGMRATLQLAAGSLQPIPLYVQNFLDANVAPDGTIKLTIHAEVTDALLSALKAAGATDVSSFPQYKVAYARIPIAQALAIAGLPEVSFIGLFDPGTTQRYRPSEPELAEWRQRLADIGGGTNVGASTSQGVVAHKANLVHAKGITGTGVKVCVMSDGVDSLAARVTTGDLPAGVDVVAGQAGSGDEGTAMLEIVHDMAPGATLGFATALNSEAQMATNILTLRNAPHNCDIIVDDFTYFFEAPFQDGPIAQAVNTVTAGGAIYFSSAANSGSLARGTSGTWEGDFVNGGTITGPESGTIHAFSTGVTVNTLTAPTKNLVLTWSDPMGGSNNDYDLFVLNAAGSAVIGSSTGVQNGTQPPHEGIFQGSNPAFPSGSKIIVVNFQGAAATRGLRVDTERGRLSIGTAGNTFGHNAAATAITVAAVDVATASGGAFVGGATNPVETFSSDGPRKIFYTPAGAAITPGNVLFGTNGGTTLSKVNMAAADGVVTQEPPASGLNPFFGTSAAAPHAAAIAALIKSVNHSLTAAQIKTAMTSTALDIQAVGFDVNAGSGLIMADAAVNSVRRVNLTPLQMLLLLE